MLNAGILAGALVAAAPLSIWGHFLDQGQVMCSTEGYFLLMLLDLDGDGKDEVFLADPNHCGTGGCPWLVYTPTESPGRVRYAGSVAFGMVAYSKASHVLLGSWHMSAAESVQTCWQLEQRELRKLSVAECEQVPWAPARLAGEARYRWVREHEPLRFRALVNCSAGPQRGDWVEQHRRPISSQRIPELAGMQVVNPQKHEK